MNQIILIVLAVVAGKFVDAPLWQTSLAVAGAVWAMNQINEVEKWSD